MNETDRFNSSTTLKEIAEELAFIESALVDAGFISNPYSGRLPQARRLIEYYVYTLEPQIRRLAELIYNNKEFFDMDVYPSSGYAVETARDTLERIINESNAKTQAN